jgi:hypothetical protein
MLDAQSKAAGSAFVIWIAAGMLPVLCGCSAQSAQPGTAPPVVNARVRANPSGTGNTAKAASTPRTIELVIDYGDGAQKRFTDIGWRESTTVLDVLQVAEQHAHGLTFSAKGSGETAMVTKLDDLTNQGGATDAKNWVYRINGRAT